MGALLQHLCQCGRSYLVYVPGAILDSGWTRAWARQSNGSDMDGTDHEGRESAEALQARDLMESLGLEFVDSRSDGALPCGCMNLEEVLTQHHLDRSGKK